MVEKGIDQMESCVDTETATAVDSIESMVRNSLNVTKEEFLYFEKEFNFKAFASAVNAIDPKLPLFLSGVGKSGIIAKKIAATLSSTAFPAFYLNPTDALHGDLGMVTPRTQALLLSKSGESEEIVRLASYLKEKETKIFSFISQSSSRLEKLSDYTLFLPMRKELCPYNLAPTTSTLVQLIAGDILSVVLMQKRGLQVQQYALNHPGGKIGVRSRLYVQDVMLKGRETPLVNPEAVLNDVLPILSEKRCGCVLVVEKDLSLKGIFTDGDLRRSLEKWGGEALKMHVEGLMTKNPMAIKETALAWDALCLMESRLHQPVNVLPVLNSLDKVVGILRLHDLIRSGL